MLTIPKLLKSFVTRFKLALKAFFQPYKAGYALPLWVDGRETFDLDSNTITGQFRNLFEYEMTSADREWKQLMFYYEMASLAKKVPGNYAEFGVSGGVSLIAFARILKVLERGLDWKEQREIYGFDSFEGLPKLHDHDDPKQNDNEHMLEGGFCDPEGYKHLLKFVETADNVTLVKGWFCDTLPKFLKENPAITFSLVYIDCDLYESTKDVLENIWGHVSPGGIVLFDELYHKDFPGETLAFKEFFKDKSSEFDLFKSEIKPDKKYIIKR